MKVKKSTQKAEILRMKAEQKARLMLEIYEDTRFSSNIAKRIDKLENELREYMEKNSLDPRLNWVADKTHGPIIKDYLNRIQRLRDQLVEYQNAINRKKGEIEDSANLNRILKKPHLIPPKDKRNGIDRNGYVYPEIEGVVMDKTMKKRYRKKMRQLMNTMHHEEAKRRTIEYLMNSEVIRNNNKLKKLKMEESIEEMTAPKKARKK